MIYQPRNFDSGWADMLANDSIQALINRALRHSKWLWEHQIIEFLGLSIPSYESAFPAENRIMAHVELDNQRRTVIELEALLTLTRRDQHAVPTVR